MNPLGWAAKQLAAAVHDAVAEFRRLDAPPPAPEPPAQPEINCTQASTQVTWQRTARPPAAPFGFRSGGNGGNGQ